jgi:hypothetical protein
MVILNFTKPTFMRELNLKHRIAAVAVVLLVSFAVLLNSCNNSTKTTETTSKDSSNKVKLDTNTMLKNDSKGGQEPPPH